MYRFSMAFLAATVLIACDGGNDSDSGDDTGECPNTIVSSFPDEGTTDAYYRTTVEVRFDDAEDDATFTVSSSAGDVDGDYAWSGDTLVFTPDEPFSPSTDYTTSITYSCGNPEVAWRTSEIGAPVTGDLDGRSYLLDLASGRFVEPEGVGELIGDYLDQIVLIGVDSVDDDAHTIDMLGALGVQGSTGGAHTEDMDHIEQDSCLPSIPFPSGIDFNGNPFFQAGPADTTLTVAGYTVTVQDLAISGAFAPDATYLSGATLAGKIDTRPLVSLLDEGCDVEGNDNFPCEPDAICSLAVTLGVTCEPCGPTSTATSCAAEGAEDACCLSLLVDSIEAVELLDETDGPWALTYYSDLGSDDPLTDPCIVNSDECASEPDCL